MYKDSSIKTCVCTGISTLVQPGAEVPRTTSVLDTNKKYSINASAVRKS